MAVNFNRNMTPDFIGSFMQGQNFRQMLDKRDRQQAVRDAFSSSVVQGPDGKPMLDKGMALSKMWKDDPQTAMAYQSQIEKQQTSAQTLKASQEMNRLKLLESQQRQKSLEDYRGKSLSLREKGIEAMAKSRAAAKGTKRGRQIEQDWQRLAMTITNPSSRRKLGRYQQNIDSADAVITLTDSIGMPEGQNAPKNETHKQAINRLNNADTRQIQEVIRSLDRLLSQAAPTVQGQEHLTPNTLGGLFAKFGEKVMGSPKGANQGEFLVRFLDTVKRERGLSVMKQDQTLKRFGLGFKNLKESDPGRFKQLIMSEPVIQQTPQQYYQQPGMAPQVQMGQQGLQGGIDLDSMSDEQLDQILERVSGN